MSRVQFPEQPILPSCKRATAACTPTERQAKLTGIHAGICAAPHPAHATFYTGQAGQQGPSSELSQHHPLSVQGDRGESGWCSDMTSTHGAWRHAGVRFLLSGGWPIGLYHWLSTKSVTATAWESQSLTLRRHTTHPWQIANHRGRCDHEESRSPSRARAVGHETRPR